MSDLKFIKIFVPLVLGGGFSIPLRGNSVENNCPNILFIITDDQSFPYCSAYGSAFVNTPAFDFIAKLHIPADTRSAFPVISVQSPVSIQCCWQS